MFHSVKVLRGFGLVCNTGQHLVHHPYPEVSGKFFLSESGWTGRGDLGFQIICALIHHYISSMVNKPFVILMIHKYISSFVDTMSSPDLIWVNPISIHPFFDFHSYKEG